MMAVKGYNGRAPGAKIVDKIILLVSDPIIHVELYDEKTGLSFSSEAGLGPRWKAIHYTHPERWPQDASIPLLMLSEEAEERIRRRATAWERLAKANYSRYDYRGAIGTALTGADKPTDLFCSEAVYDVIAPEIGLSPRFNYRMTPQKLIDVLKIILAR